MSYKLDSTTIAPEIFDLPEMNNTKRSKKGKKSKGKGKSKGPVTVAVIPGSSQESEDPQSSQSFESKQTGPSPILPESDFWKKPPGFCDVTLKDALAPIKRDGVEIPTAINESHVIRYAAAEIERINKTYREVKKENNIDEDSMEGMSWYLGQEDSERRQAAAKRAKYAGNRKGKATGKVATLSQLRAAAAAAKMASNEQAGSSTVPPKNTGKQAARKNAHSKPASRHQPIPIDSGSDSESEYHDADCECGCVSASDCSECEGEEETHQRHTAAQTSSPRRPSLAGTSSSEAESNDEYEGSECGCEGEYCDSDCDFYPPEFYSSEVYFKVARSNTAAGAPASASTPSRTQIRILPPAHRNDLVRRRLSSCMPIAEEFARSLGADNKPVSDKAQAALRRSPRLRATEGRGVFNPLDNRCAPNSSPVPTTSTSRHKLDVSAHSPAAKRRRPANQDHYGPTYERRSSGERHLRPATLGQLALNPGGPAECNFEYTPAIRPGSMIESYQAEKAASPAPTAEDKTRRGIEEIERQRMFLQTLLADHKKMEGETEEILSRSPSSASSSLDLSSPVATSPPRPNFEDDDVLVVRRPSMPYAELNITDPYVDITRRPSLPDFDTASVEALNFADYDSDSDPWTFIQQATARDIMRSERVGAELPVEMLARLQKSSRREAFGLWRERLRSRQAESEAAGKMHGPTPATLPPMRTSLPSRPRANQRTYTAKKKDAFSADQAGISAKDRATAMKLQLEAVMGSPSLEALVEEQTSRAFYSKQPASGSMTQAERDRASSRARAVLEAHFQVQIQDQVQSESRAPSSQQSSTGSSSTDENSQAARQESALRALALETARDFCSDSERLEEQAFAEVRELALQARESGRFRPLRRAPTLVPLNQRGGGAELSKKLAASVPKSQGDFYGDHVPIEDKKKRIAEINEEIRVLSSAAGQSSSSQRVGSAELSKTLAASVPKFTPADFYAHAPVEDKKKRIADINEEIRILSSEAAKEARELASVGRAQLVAAGIDPKRIASIQAKYSECHSARLSSHVHAATARGLRRKQKPYRTPEELFDLGWEGWTNLTPEEEKVKEQWEEDMRRKRNFKECPLAWRAKRVEERSRTTFGCLLCVEGHLATF